MKKLIGLSFLAFGLLFGASRAEAAAPTRSAKGSTNINYSTTVSTITAGGAGVVYGVVLSTGTAGTDYLVLWDIAATGATAIGTGTGMKAKIVVTSTTQNTAVYFDPPLQFVNGIAAANSAATMWSSVIWERGRVTQGY